MTAKELIHVLMGMPANMEVFFNPLDDDSEDSLCSIEQAEIVQVEKIDSEEKKDVIILHDL